jgi:hypothetical protein
MKFNMEVQMDNAAFDENWGDDELIRIFRDMADRMEEGGGIREIIKDSNGKSVGSVRFTSRHQSEE